MESRKPLKYFLAMLFRNPDNLKTQTGYLHFPTHKGERDPFQKSHFLGPKPILENSANVTFSLSERENHEIIYYKYRQYAYCMKARSAATWRSLTIVNQHELQRVICQLTNPARSHSIRPKHFWASPVSKQSLHNTLQITAVVILLV